MPRPRQPTNVLALKGAFKHDPKRGAARAGEPEATEAIGEPPETLSPEARACWVEIVALAHAGTLCASDRMVVEHGAQVLAQLRADEWRVPTALMVRWERILGSLGMTPADRSRVQVRKVVDKSDPLDEFVTPDAASAGGLLLR